MNYTSKHQRKERRGPGPVATARSAAAPPGTAHAQHQAAHAAAAVPARAPGPAQLAAQQAAALAALGGAPRPSYLTDTTFASLPLAAPTQRALAEVLRFTHLTAVQEATLPAVLQGGDVMAKAKTGTGKTMAFLIPALESLCRRVAGRPRPPVASPCCERNRLAGRCDILVATPGRLQDHLQNSGLGQARGRGCARMRVRGKGRRACEKLASIRTLVLDEADQLLEMGFRPAIERILAQLPAQRQTLLFSATMPQAVKAVAGLALRPQYAFIDTVPPEEANTHRHVEQRYALVPLEEQFSAVHAALRAHIHSTPGFKVIAFFTTARLTQYMAALMNAAGLEVLEIHSRKSQAQREKASAAFRGAASAILFSSDVSARGVDYPDISLVLQIGLPSSREQYIHRLGRTARAGKAGQGLLLLTPEEQHFLATLQGLPVAPCDGADGGGLPITAADRAAVAAALRRVDVKVAEMAYVAWLGFYNSARMGWSKPELVARANGFAAVMGLPQPPAMMKKTIGMMGLKGVPGLRIEEGGGGRGGGGRGGGGQQQQQAPAAQQYAAPQQQQQQRQQHVQAGRPGGAFPYPPRQPQQQQQYQQQQPMLTEQQLLQSLQQGGSGGGSGGGANGGGKRRSRGGRGRRGGGGGGPAANGV
eukprot:scaffold14.g1294.t1